MRCGPVAPCAVPPGSCVVAIPDRAKHMMPAAIQLKNPFIARSFPRIGCLEKLDADAIRGVLPGPRMCPTSARSKIAAACAKNFAFERCLTRRVRRLPKGHAKVNHGLRRFMPLIDCFQSSPNCSDSQNQLLNTSVVCADY